MGAVVEWAGSVGSGDVKRDQYLIRVDDREFLQNLWTNGWEMFIESDNLRSHRRGYWRKVTSHKRISQLNLLLEEALLDNTVVGRPF